MAKRHYIPVTADVPGVNDGLRALIRRAIRTALEAEGVDFPCEIDVRVADDQTIHEINLETRGVDRPTDVLSFPAFALTPGHQPCAGVGVLRTGQDARRKLEHRETEDVRGPVHLPLLPVDIVDGLVICDAHVDLAGECHPLRRQGGADNLAEKGPQAVVDTRYVRRNRDIVALCHNSPPMQNRVLREIFLLLSSKRPARRRSTVVNTGS